MAREKGKINLAINFEPGGATPLDSRLVVETYDDLTKAYPSNNVYVGMVVSVLEEEYSGLYRLKALPYTDVNNWEKIGSDVSGYIEGLGDRVTAVENAVETKADADAVYSKTDADGKFATKSSVDTLTAQANLVEEIATQNTVSLITINSNHSALAERVSAVETALTGVEQLLATI